MSPEQKIQKKLSIFITRQTPTKETVEKLLLKIEVSKNWYFNPLEAAVKSRRKELVWACISHGICLNSVNAEGLTAMRSIARSFTEEEAEIVQCLLGCHLELKHEIADLLKVIQEALERELFRFVTLLLDTRPPIEIGKVCLTSLSMLWTSTRLDGRFDLGDITRILELAAKKVSPTNTSFLSTRPAYERLEASLILGRAEETANNLKLCQEIQDRLRIPEDTMVIAILMKNHEAIRGLVQIFIRQMLNDISNPAPVVLYGAVYIGDKHLIQRLINLGVHPNVRITLPPGLPKTSLDLAMSPEFDPEIRKILQNSQDVFDNIHKMRLKMRELFFRSNQCYNTDENGSKGMLLVFSNENFSEKSGLASRKGSATDNNLIIKAFVGSGSCDLRYELYGGKIHIDYTSAQMEQMLKEFTSDKTLKSYSSIIVMFSTHGNKDGILHASDQPTNIKTIIQYFDNSNCPYMKGKPKLLIINACRGDQVSRRSAEDNAFSVNSEFDGIGMVQFLNTDAGPWPGFQKGAAGSNRDGRGVIRITDFIAAYFTLPDHYSFRNVVQGSNFIRILCDVFEDKDNTNGSDVRELLDIVSTRLAQYSTSSSVAAFNDATQCAEIVSTVLTKKWYMPYRN